MILARDAAAYLMALAGLTLHAQPALCQPAPVASLRDQLAADAATRDSLTSASATSGRANNRFFVSDGGNNKLELTGIIQFRYLANFTDSDAPAPDSTIGFQTRHAQLLAIGTIWDKNLSYQVQGEFGRGDGTFGLLDVWGKYTWDNGAYVRFGQFRPTLLREENTPERFLLTAERSVTNQVFAQGRSQGINAGWLGEEVRVSADFTDGFNAGSTDFDTTGRAGGTIAGEADYALTGRFDWMFASSPNGWKRFDDHTSFRSDQGFAGMFGLGAHWQAGGDTGAPGSPPAAGTNNRSVFEATGDLTLEWPGFNAYAALLYRNVDAAGSPAFDDLGVVVQGGTFITDQTELFARYDVVIPDNDRPGGHDAFHTVTAGCNYYVTPASHAIKLTGDIIYFINAQADSASVVAPNTIQGLLASPSEGQAALRLQIQLFF